jgi:putative ABC transport system permease protein
MNIRQGFKMASKSIFSNKVRSFLTMLGIIIGVAAVVIMVSVVQGQNQKIKENFEAMGTNKVNVSAARFNGQDVTQDLYDYCLGLKDLILGVTPNGSYYGPVKYMTKSTESNQQYGMSQTFLGSDQFALCNNYKLQEGRDICWLDVKNYNQVVVIGAKLKEFLFDYKDPIGEKISIGGQKFEVIGVYEAKGSEDNWYLDYMCVVPYSMNRMLNKQSMFSEFSVKAKSADATTEAITRLTGFLTGQINSNNGYFNVWTDNTWMEQSDQQNRMMSLVLGGIAGISLLVGGIGIMNIMLVSVSERTREIGIRKAIGASRGNVLTQFLVEALVVSLFGGLLGLGLAVGLAGILGKALSMSVVISPQIAFLAIAFSMIVGVIFLVVFGTVSIGTWAYFRFRPVRAGEDRPGEAPAE